MGNYIMIYGIGFIITLIFLILFGKKIGIDYDPPHPSYYDDYNTNGEAYLAFSLGWFIVIPIFSVVKLFQILVTIIDKIKR